MLEAGDGLALAGPSPVGKHVLFLEALNDETVANQACEALATNYGASQLKLSKLSVPTRIVKLPEVAAPYTAPTVRALVQLDPASHVMFTQQHGQQAYQPPFPPFLKRPQPVEVDNPIEVVHTLAVSFADSYRLAGTPTVSDPTQ